MKASADVDGERLESQEFPAPAQGGIRLMLVATDKERRAAGGRERAGRQRCRSSSEPSIAHRHGAGRRERCACYYLLDIMNTARAPVNPPSPFAFDMPTDAQGARLSWKARRRRRR